MEDEMAAGVAAARVASAEAMAHEMAEERNNLAAKLAKLQANDQVEP
jgi:hypothetical protein